MTTDNAQGIDISRYQPNVDWAAVKSAGISFAFCKATETINYKDPTFDQNWQGIKAAGILRGAYHFFRPAMDPKRQANFFAQTVQWEAADLPPVLDVETDGGLDRNSFVKAIELCLTELERITGRRIIIYTGPNIWNTRAANPTAPPWTSNYYLWVAHYTSAPQPIVPKGWTAWNFWQYTESGTVSGYKGRVDRNHFNGTVDALMQWVPTTVSGAAPVPPPTPTPPPTPQPQPSSGPEVIQRYFQALNNHDPEAVVGLYQPNAAHVSALQTVSGADAIRRWYQDLLQNKLAGGNYAAGAVKPAGASWAFSWTCSSPSGTVLDGQDTLGLQDGKIVYHSSVFNITAK